MKLVLNKIILGLSICFFSACSTESEKNGVIDLPVVYSSFDYQKEMMIAFGTSEQSLKLRADSLDREINLLEQSLKFTDEYTVEEKNYLFENAYSDYIYKKNLIQNENDSLAADYTDKIWKQLNAYISDFGRENDFDLILGMQGNGSVMFVKEENNITESVIEYVNRKYNGE